MSPKPLQSAKIFDSYTHVPALLLVFLLIGLNGCSRLLAIHYSADKVLHGSLSGQPVEHVVIFAIDGLEQATLVKVISRSIPRETREACMICSECESMPVGFV